MNILKRAHEIMLAEANAILNVPLSTEFEKAVLQLSLSNKIVTTGMGKAGNVARKTAGTFCSTGAVACFLHPGEAAHGDLGLITPGDHILAFSTSGKTREVLETIELARRLGATNVVSITSHVDAPIRALSDIVIDMGIIREPCKLGLTPSASTAAMLALGDALALCMLEQRTGFDAEDYALRHHGGYLGKIALKGEKNA